MASNHRKRYCGAYADIAITSYAGPTATGPWTLDPAVTSPISGHHYCTSTLVCKNANALVDVLWYWHVSDWVFYGPNYALQISRDADGRLFIAFILEGAEHRFYEPGDTFCVTISDPGVTYRHVVYRLVDIGVRNICDGCPKPDWTPEALPPCTGSSSSASSSQSSSQSSSGSSDSGSGSASSSGGSSSQSGSGSSGSGSSGSGSSGGSSGSSGSGSSGSGSGTLEGCYAFTYKQCINGVWTPTYFEKVYGSPPYTALPSEGPNQWLKHAGEDQPNFALFYTYLGNDPECNYPDAQPEASDPSWGCESSGSSSGSGSSGSGSSGSASGSGSSSQSSSQGLSGSDSGTGSSDTGSSGGSSSGSSSSAIPPDPHSYCKLKYEGEHLDNDGVCHVGSGTNWEVTPVGLPICESAGHTIGGVTYPDNIWIPPDKSGVPGGCTWVMFKRDDANTICDGHTNNWCNTKDWTDPDPPNDSGM